MRNRILRTIQFVLKPREPEQRSWKWGIRVYIEICGWSIHVRKVGRFEAAGAGQDIYTKVIYYANNIEL